MQNQLNNLQQDYSDMATIMKMLEAFDGQKSTEAWMKRIIARTRLFNLTEEITRKIVILLLRNTAEDWYVKNQDELNALSFPAFQQRLIKRFNTQVSTERILEKFLDKQEVRNSQEYEELLTEASKLVSRESISGASIIKLVIKKTPPKIQAILFLIAETSSNWQEFKARASDVVWLGFEETSSINVIRWKRENQDKPQKWRKAGAKYDCKLHGKNSSHDTLNRWTLKKVREMEQRENMKINS